ncbi:hypothetical protein GDO81_005471 [Engystomops pustulosus]|uniref:Uncharacterized protein n=1 Tax=Engystomops pustulosus TaxID=76066 RepID=A0AAV7CNT1_ENGPU|nr:hypothetical protein GDO81_005471 [Engystomops pustulosus]
MTCICGPVMQICHKVDTSMPSAGGHFFVYIIYLIFFFLIALYKRYKCNYIIVRKHKNNRKLLYIFLSKSTFHGRKYILAHLQ